MKGEVMNRPEYCTDEMLDYLDDLRASGETNMYGAGRYLESAFPAELGGAHPFHSSQQAGDVLLYWMKTYPRKERNT